LGLLDTWVHVLQDTDRESTGLSCSGLSLGDCVLSFDNREDALLLDLRGLLIPVTEDTAKKVWVKVKLFKGVHRFCPVGLNISSGNDFHLLFRLFLYFFSFSLFDLFFLLLELFLSFSFKSFFHISLSFGYVLAITG
jgi:hypothetical protein